MSEKDEIQINFRDYILYTLKRWRSIIAVALVFALIAAGLVVFKSLNSWDENLSKYDAELVTYNEEKEAYDTNIVAFTLAIDIFKRDFENAENYFANSILINLDASNLLTVNTELMLVKNGEEMTENVDTNTVLKAYYSFLYDYADWDAIGELINTEPEYAKELVEAEIDFDGGEISLKVFYPDDGYSYAIADKLITEANSSMELYDFFNGYEMKIINQSLSYEYSEELVEYLSDRKEAFDKAKTDYETGQENLERFISEEEPKAPEMSKNLSRTHITLVAIVVGFVGFAIGAFLMFIIYYNRFVKKGIIFSAGEFTRITDVSELAVFPIEKNGKKRWFGFVDKIIDSKRDDNKNTESFAYERIKIHFDNLKNADNILVIGGYNEKCNSIINNLQKENENKKFSLYEDFSSNEALKKLYECDGVIFIVEREKTMLAEVLRNKKAVEDSEKKLIGNIVL